MLKIAFLQCLKLLITYLIMLWLGWNFCYGKSFGKLKKTTTNFSMSCRDAEEIFSTSLYIYRVLLE